MKQFSILNDVMGPIMCGPSSSHTAGPGKIGLAVARLWGKPITRANVVYDENGSYPGTHVGQGSDFGFAGGLLGMATHIPCFRDALTIAKKNGIQITFSFADLQAEHPNEARIDVYDDGQSEASLSVLSRSTGGGTFVLTSINGFPIEYDGQRSACFLTVGTANEASALERKLCAAGLRYHTSHSDKRLSTWFCLKNKEAVLFDVQADDSEHEKALEQIAAATDRVFLYQTAPIAAIPLSPVRRAPFSTASEAISHTNGSENTTMAELALAYECALGGINREEANRHMHDVLEAMRGSMLPPPSNDPVQMKILPHMAAKIAQRQFMPIDMGLMNGCMAAAAAVMENSCTHRIIVAAPTAGASGVIPACIVAVGEKLGCSTEEIINGLWAAGLVGCIIANQATFGAEVAGCQAEIGSAACMAAAGAVQLLGGSVMEGFQAASIAMHSFLGLICDPIGGLTELPCIERNMTASAVAIMSANMALCGIDPMIPLDETVQTMLAVGKQLPGELRCTCGGGLCATQTGRALECQVKRLRQEENSAHS